MNDIDTAAARVFEQSAIVRGIERGATRLRSAASSSILLGRSKSWLRTARPHTGDVLVAAAAMHLLLIVTIGRPPSWHFAILPSLFLLAGLAMMATANRGR